MQICFSSLLKMDKKVLPSFEILIFQNTSYTDWLREVK